MDEFDRKIIGELAVDGRMSFRDLGKRIHLSPNATAERVRRLQAAGVIRGFRAEFDLVQLGFSIEAYIDVRMRPGTTAESFEASIKKIAGITSAAILTGEFDFRLRVACKDQADLVRVIETLRIQASAQETSSALICKEIDAIAPTQGRVSRKIPSPYHKLR